MEKKQGFFSEMVRGLSPARSRGRSKSRSVSPGSGLLRRRRGAAHHAAPPEPSVSRSGSMRPPPEALSPLMEGPDPEGMDGGDSRMERWGHWMKGQLCRAPSHVSSSSSVAAASAQRSDLRLLLGVLGAPLAPVHVSNIDPLPHLSIKDIPIVSILFCYLINFVYLLFSLPLYRQRKLHCNGNKIAQRDLRSDQNSRNSQKIDLPSSSLGFFALVLRVLSCLLNVEMPKQCVLRTLAERSLSSNF